MTKLTLLSLPSSFIIKALPIATTSRRLSTVRISTSFVRLSNMSSSSLNQQDEFFPDAVTYLEEILEIVKRSKDNDDDNNAVSLTITQKHVKTMIRSLLGLTKIEMDIALAKFQKRKDWNDVETFVQETHGPALFKILEQGRDTIEDDNGDPSSSSLSSLAPQLEDGLENYRNIFDPTTSSFSKRKVFSYMARGRTYQGQIERLLEDKLPQLLPSFQERYMNTDKNRLIHDFVMSRVEELAEEDTNDEIVTVHHASDSNQQQRHSHISKSMLRQGLLDCISSKFPSSRSQPEDSGKANGLKSESKLVSFLQSLILSPPSSTSRAVPSKVDTAIDSDCDNRSNDKKTNDLMTGKGIRILSPVHIIRNATKRNVQKCPYALEMLNTRKPSSSLNNKNKTKTQPSKNQGNNSITNNAMFGMTSEWDAIVVSTDEEEQCARIFEVWESKSSLHPITIHDVLTKKYDSMIQLFDSGSNSGDNATSNISPFDSQPLSSLRLWIDNKSFLVGVNNVIDETEIPMPQLGIFGSNLWSTHNAAKHYQQTMIEEYLQRTPRIVIEYALKTGKVPATVSAFGQDDYYNTIIQPLEKLLETARKIQPRMVVAYDSGAARTV